MQKLSFFLTVWRGKARVGVGWHLSPQASVRNHKWGVTVLYLTQMASDNYLLLAISSYLSMFCMPRYQFRYILNNVFRVQIFKIMLYFQ